MTEHAFQADVSRVLHLVVHSLYSNREIFLRELVSNASDAIDKLRFAALTDASVYGTETALEIKITTDAEKNTITIEDTGCGMSEEEVVQNLGTVAHSGTQALLAKLKDAKDAPNLIGQFGVGFYSAFLIASSVDVVTRKAGADTSVRWSSDAESGKFTLVPGDKATRGTSITLHLKDDAKEYLDAWRIKDLIARYSDYVSHPISVAEQKGTEDLKFDQANRGSALWQRPASEVTQEQYSELYKHVTHDFADPALYTHFRIEGNLELSGILYLPKTLPYDLFEVGKRKGIRLFVKRVFIMDDCEEILPTWLRFVRGVVDSNDLPLNVSREILQDSSMVRGIRKHVVKKSLEMIEELAKKDDYNDFARNFGVVLKEGVATEGEYRDRIANLLRFESTHEHGKLTSLADYKARAKPEQKVIYYLYGSAKTAVANSPYIEGYKKSGHEVLLLSDPIDEWMCESLREFEGLKLQNVMKTTAPESDASKEESKVANDRLAPLFERAKKVLGNRVADVVSTQKLVDSPACLTLGDDGVPAYMEALLRANGRPAPESKRVLELNDKHAVIEKLLSRAGDESTLVDDALELLFVQAKIAEGSSIDDPVAFGAKLSNMLTRALS
jgi:molecular chaperone HtpG